MVAASIRRSQLFPNRNRSPMLTIRPNRLVAQLPPQQGRKLIAYRLADQGIAGGGEVPVVLDV